MKLKVFDCTNQVLNEQLVYNNTHTTVKRDVIDFV